MAERSALSELSPTPMAVCHARFALPYVFEATSPLPSLTMRFARHIDTSARRAPPSIFGSLFKEGVSGGTCVQSSRHLNSRTAAAKTATAIIRVIARSIIAGPTFP